MPATGGLTNSRPTSGRSRPAHCYRNQEELTIFFLSSAEEGSRSEAAERLRRGGGLAGGGIPGSLPFDGIGALSLAGGRAFEKSMLCFETNFQKKGDEGSGAENRGARIGQLSFAGLCGASAVEEETK